MVFLVCMVTSRVLSTGRDNGVPSPLAVAVAVVGAVALGSAAATMLRQTINDNARRLVNLAHRAASAEVNVRHGQEKMHELNATVAGVAQASRLLVRDGGPTGAQRRTLETLLDTEMARLERMLTRRGQQPVRSFCPRRRPAAARRDPAHARHRRGLPALGPAGAGPARRHRRSRAHPAEQRGAPRARRGGHDQLGPMRQRGRDPRLRRRPGVPAELRASLFTWGTAERSHPARASACSSPSG